MYCCIVQLYEVEITHLVLFLIFPFYLRHSLSKTQYQYALPCYVEDNRRVNNWSVTQSFYDSKHNAKHSYNNNNSSLLRMINEVSKENV